MPEPVNLLDPELTGTVGLLLGARALGMSVYDLPPGASGAPYHYELGREEWAIVLAGQPTLRTPAGERELAPNDVVCFPDGETGAHKLTNRTQERVRVVLLSTKGSPAGCIYPDSGKVAYREIEGVFRLRDAVDYWEGE